MNPLLSALLRVVLFCAGTVVAFLPRGLEVRLGRGLGRLLLAFDFKRYKIARQNISRCLPELSAAQREQLLRENYRHYGVLALEILHFFAPFPGHYRAYARRVAVLEGYDHWRAAHDRGRGVLVVSAHLANWELMVAIGTMQGIPMTMVTRHLKPEWLHRLIESRRLSVGARAVYQPRTLPTVLKALRRGESIGFVMDQYAPPPMGIPVPFFGVPVDTLAAVGTLAERTGAAIVLVSQVRDRAGMVHVVISPGPDLGTDRADPVRVTARLAREVEAMIRATPAQWLWVHRRFKNLKAS